MREKSGWCRRQTDLSTTQGAAQPPARAVAPEQRTAGSCQPCKGLSSLKPPPWSKNTRSQAATIPSLSLPASAEPPQPNPGAFLGQMGIFGVDLQRREARAARCLLKLLLGPRLAPGTPGRSARPVTHLSPDRCRHQSPLKAQTGWQANNASFQPSAITHFPDGCRGQPG